MEIFLYARNANQEYSSKPGEPAEYLYEWPDRGAVTPLIKVQKIKTNPKLNSIIKVRPENSEYGFIHNVENGLIFYADDEALKLVMKHLEETLSELYKSEDAWIFSELQVY